MNYSSYVVVEKNRKPMALFQGETTAWEDVQIKLGNYAERPPKSPSMEERSSEVLLAAEKITSQEFVDKLFEAKSPQDHNDHDLMALRQARLEQLKRQDTQSVVRRITKERYTDEVTEGSKHAVIVVLMDRGGGSSFLESDCRKLATEWVSEIAPSKGLENYNVRFYVGDVDELISNEFPSTSLPFAVIYSKGAAQTQMPKATILGIRQNLISITKEAKITSKAKPPSEDEEYGDRDIRREIAIRRVAANSDSDENDDVSDDERNRQGSKGYLSTHFERNVLRFK